MIDRMHGYLDHATRSFPHEIAIEEPGKGSISYADLSTITDALGRRLCQLGVRRGDRVGIYMRKSVDAVASILGILKTGAAYVPVDPSAPVSRNAYILNDCSVRVVIT